MAGPRVCNCCVHLQLLHVLSLSLERVGNGNSDASYPVMPLIQILVALIVVGILLGLVNRFIPMAGSIKSILNAVVVICVVVWLLNVFGLLDSITKIRVGRL